MGKGFVIGVLVLLLLACHPARKIVTDAMPEINWPELRDSRLYINVSVPVQSLEDLINAELEKSLSQGLMMEDGYRIEIKLEDRLRLNVDGFNVLYNTPLHLKVFPFRTSRLFAEGSINLDFSTRLKLQAGDMVTETRLLDHKWLSTPKLNLLGVRLPIESISDLILKKFNLHIVSAIDSSLMQTLDVPALKAKAALFFNRPVYTYDSTVHFYAVPKTIALQELKINGETLLVPIAVHLNALCSDLSRLGVTDSIQLSFAEQWQTESLFYMQIHLSQKYLNKLVKASVEGQQFGSGVTKVLVHQVDFQGFQREIGVRLSTTGAYKGDMEIRFIPAFDPSRNKIFLEDLVLIPQTKHGLSKTILDVFRALAENQLKKSLEASFNELLLEYQVLILELLNTKYLDDQLELQGDIIDFEIADFISDKDQCIFNLQARLNLEAHILQIKN